MDETYSIWTGLIYVFNLIVGTGPLTLPNSFSQAGWLMGVVLITLLAVFSYMTVTFVVEAMAVSNAIIQWNKMRQLQRVSQTLSMVIQNVDSEDDGLNNTEETPLCRAETEKIDKEIRLQKLCNIGCWRFWQRCKSGNRNVTKKEHLQNFPSSPVKFYSIDEKVEMGEMANMLFPRYGQILFYLCFCLYLFGDLSIYSAAISNSLVDVFCLGDRNSTVNTDVLCWWSNYNVTEKDSYRIFLVIFLVLFGPFVFFNVQKTKYLQILTTISRWLAFSVMIVFAIRRLLTPYETHGSPVMARLSGVPALFGSCIYSFMCHHSLPGLLTPIVNKTRLHRALAADYVLVLAFYLTLALTGVYAFPKLNALYTLNFTPNPEDPIILRSIDYYLTLFPVFTLSTSFPVVAVTLRSNIQSLISPQRSNFLRNIVVPALAVSSPVILAMVVQDIQILVGFTGSYAGNGIQYVIPAFLVIAARSSIPDDLKPFVNEFKSPFSSNWWPISIAVWAFVCAVFVTVDMVNESLH